MKYFAKNWEKITSDKSILDIVNHCHLQIKDGIDPINTVTPRCQFKPSEEHIIESEIQKLLEMQVLIEVEHDPREYLSPIFIRNKKDGEYRLILNLKNFNENVDYHHFKMDTFESALKLIKPNCYMALVDIRHAYYSISIAEEERIKLRFMFKGKVFQYVSLANGVAAAPLLFTKLMKPVYAALRQLGHSNSGFIDDSLLVGDTYDECKVNVADSVYLMNELGFIIHEKKSIFIPTKTITFLGNTIHSSDMTVTLPVDKVHLIVQECMSLRKKSHETIRKVARVLGLIVSTFSAVEYGPLHYRDIEMQKIKALKYSKGNFDNKMQITNSMREELTWWITNLHTQKRHIDHSNPDLVITKDASLIGWGAVSGNESIGGKWNEIEVNNHINVLEMIAVMLALKSFCKDLQNSHILIRSDNVCTISYLNSKGGVKSLECNKLAKLIWSWCIDRNIWLSATYVPGSQNEADHSSRSFKNEGIEWKLEKQVFQSIVQTWHMPKIDMFASRLNKQIEKYVAWKRDPDAVWINAFSQSWTDIYFYAFPPFSLIGRCLQKVLMDRAECVMVAPLWPTQNWYPELMKLLVDFPRILPQGNILSLVNSNKVHPLTDKLRLIACRLSGDHMKTETFHRKLQISSLPHGESVLKNNMIHISKNGFHSVTKGKVIPFIQI